MLRDFVFIFFFVKREHWKHRDLFLLAGTMLLAAVVFVCAGYSDPRLAA